MRRSQLLALTLAVGLGACSSQKPTCQGGCACQAQSECPTGQSCVAGFCAATETCATAQDCSDPSDVCVGGFCVLGSQDAGPDGGRPDSGPPDSGTDAGHEDAGPDAGPDGGRTDAGPDGGPDSGYNDAGSDGGPDSGPTPDAGGCTQPSDCATGVCLDGACANCTANAQCVSPMICCLSGSCTPGACIPPGCQSDTQCNPPDEICVAGDCVKGCLLGGCDAGLRCENLVTGRCQPASGNGAPGQACQTFSDCGETPSNSNSGDCLSFVLPDGGSQSFCSFACQGTTQCPGDFVCVLLGGAGQCVPESLAGGTAEYGTGAIGASCAIGSHSCDSVPACGTYGSTGEVCSDSCLGATSEVCPTIGWQCDDVLLFAGLAGTGATCTANSTCTAISPDALCYTAALGGDGRCHLVYREEACFESPTGGPTLTTGQSCAGDSNCKFGFCNAGECSDPCCSSTDCPSNFACAPVVAQQFSVVMACVPETATGALGSACNPTAGAPNSCRAQLPAEGGGGGLCLPVDAYDATDTTGYCSDYCCSDAECGAAYTCAPYEIGTNSTGAPLYANSCLKL